MGFVLSARPGNPNKITANFFYYNTDTNRIEGVDQIAQFECIKI